VFAITFSLEVFSLYQIVPVNNIDDTIMLEKITNNRRNKKIRHCFSSIQNLSILMFKIWLVFYAW